MFSAVGIAFLQVGEDVNLPYDIHRCKGVGFEEDGKIDWREGCETCLRRTSPGNPDRQAYIAPPPIIAFECEHLIRCAANPAVQGRVKSADGKAVLVDWIGFNAASAAVRCTGE